jgi:hypothetical protein
VSEQRAEASEAGPGGIVTRLKQLTSVIAPTTIATSLLIYFGYVATRSRFDYFGVYLDMTDLSNQTLLLYGLEVVYVPAALAFLSALVVIAVHAGVTWLLASAAQDSTKFLVALAAVLGGLLLVGRALVGMLVAGVVDTEVPGTTPLALACGPIMIAYGAWIAGQVAGNRTAVVDGPSDGRLDRFARWYAAGKASRLRRGALACVVALAVTGLFWAAHQFAWAYGAGRAYDDALKLPERPGVILASKEQLGDLPPGVTETVATGAGSVAKDATFRYRYHGLRLLLASGGRLFLVPENWTTQSRTLVIPYDANVRIQLTPPPIKAG